MKKVLFLVFIFIMLSTSFVFATTYTMYFKHIPSGNTYVLTSSSPFTVNSNNYVTNSSSYRYDIIQPDGNPGGSGTYQANDYWGTTAITSPTTWTLQDSNHDVYKFDGSLFFQLPKIPPMVQGMEGALPNLLQNLVLILPIILGGIVLVVGFRKAWTMLLRFLRVT